MRNDFSSCKPTPAVDQSVRVDLQVGQETSRPVLNEHVTPGTLDPLAVVEDPVPTVPAIRLILNPQDGASSSRPSTPNWSTRHAEPRVHLRAARRHRQGGGAVAEHVGLADAQASQQPALLRDPSQDRGNSAEDIVDTLRDHGVHGLIDVEGVGDLRGVARGGS
jgi:hypothetical protein